MAPEVPSGTTLRDIVTGPDGWRACLLAGASSNENVVGLNPEGGIVWRIAPRPRVYADSPYVNLFLDEDRLCATNWDGMTVVIDPRNGTILSERFTK